MTRSHKVVVSTAEQSQRRHQVAVLGTETGQQLSLRVQHITPGQGTPLHLHREQAETFHVVSGEFRFRAGDEELRAGPGTSIHIPAGTAHCFLYLGTEADGQLISVLTPGIHDGFIRNIPQAEAEGVTPQQLAELADANGAEILGPGLS